MVNKLMDVELNNVIDNFVKTDDILKDMCGIIESSQKMAYQAVNTVLVQRNWLLGYRIASEEMHSIRLILKFSRQCLENPRGCYRGHIMQCYYR